jgi:hypothetical protein
MASLSIDDALVHLPTWPNGLLRSFIEQYELPSEGPEDSLPDPHELLEGIDELARFKPHLAVTGAPPLLPDL